MDLLEASADSLGSVKLKWRKEASVCVVMASAGYPGRIKGQSHCCLEKFGSVANPKIFHAGTLDSPVWWCKRGRVLE